MEGETLFGNADQTPTDTRNDPVGEAAKEANVEPDSVDPQDNGNNFVDMHDSMLEGMDKRAEGHDWNAGFNPDLTDKLMRLSCGLTESGSTLASLAASPTGSLRVSVGVWSALPNNVSPSVRSIPKSLRLHW